MIKDSITFTSKIKTRWLLTVFTIIWTIACFAMIGVLIWGIIETPSRLSDFIAVLIILIIAAFFTINYLIWQFQGQQNLKFRENDVVFFNSRTFFSNKFELPYSELDFVSFDNDEKTVNWIKIWGIGGGKIIIGYLGRERRFGQDLTLKAARDMTMKIQKEIDRRKN